MIKIMIVDDEPLFREYLRTSIHWADYGFTIVCEAKNGVEALEKAEQYYPDIVLTDINMPHMDGLELSKKLYSLYPDIGVVLITGHSEFEYARKAVKIGVSDYILKPFEKEELILTLLKFKDTIQKAHELKAYDKEKKDLILNGILSHLLHQDDIFKEDEIDRELERLGIKMHTKHFLVASIELDDMQDDYEEQKQVVWRFAVTNILNEIIEVDGNHISFIDYNNMIISIIEFKTLEAEKKFNIEGYNRLKSHVNKLLNFGITIGIGNIYIGYKGLKKSYLESMNALNAKYTMGINQVIFYRELPQENKDFGFYTAETNENILSYLREYHLEKTTDILHMLFSHIDKNKVSSDYTKVLHMGLISLLLSFITQSGKEIPAILGKNFSPYTELEALPTIKQQQEWIIHLYTQTITYLLKHKTTRSWLIAKKAKEYIDTQFSNSSLTVEKIAKAQFINQTYLRSMFKKEMGMTVSEYMTYVRMKESKTLLRQGIYKLSDITERVGYNDSSYFSKSFKKYYGITPSQYEKMNQ